jgi:glycosyltransferase involved in cell wall biosynthesis
MENGQLRVSIIIPSLNQGRFIKKAIDSVLLQSYNNIEIMVVDGGSTDETIKILEGYSGTIRWISEKDHGQTDAINKGLRLTNGDICGYLNSDDQLLPGAIDKVVQVFTKTDALWVSGDYKIVDSNNKYIQPFIVQFKKILRLFSSRTILSLTNYIVQPSTYWRRELIEKIGYFDETLAYVMDYDYWMRAIQIQKPIIIHSELSLFRIHNESKGGSQFVKQFKDEIQIVKKYSKNPIIISLHWILNQMIVIIYKLIK